MYHEVKKIYTLSTQCIHVFCVDLRTVSLFVYNINLVVFGNETECLLHGTD
jgi:hypothetical protein